MLPSRVRQLCLLLGCGYAESSSALDLHAADAWKLQVGGNWQYDFATIRPDQAASEDHSAWRRQRLSLTAEVGTRLEFSTEYDFESRGFNDAYVKFKSMGTGQWTLGQFKQPFALDELNSDKRNLFIESALPHSFAISRRLGLGYSWNPASLGLQASVFGRNLNGVESTNGAALRSWWVVRPSEDSLWHVGAAITREQQIAHELSYSVRPESRLSNLRAARAPTLGDVDSLWRGGLEFLLLQGSWYGQAEWLLVHHQRSLTDNYRADGWYAQLGYDFGGARRGYKAGTIQPVDRGHVFELGARVAAVDLNDGAVRGGEALSQGVVATWYLQPETRLMANFLHIRRSAALTADANRDFKIIEMRLQYVF